MSTEENETGSGPSGAPGLTRNLISIIGLAMAVVAGANIAFLVLLEALRPNPYIGIFAYMILPGIMVLGLVPPSALTPDRWHVGGGNPIKAMLKAQHYSRGCV